MAKRTTQCPIDDSGVFAAPAPYLPPGTHAIAARALEIHPWTKAEIRGPWTPFSFTVDIDPSLELDELFLVRDTGVNDDDRVSTDATLGSRLRRDEGQLEGLAIEFDHA